MGRKERRASGRLPVRYSRETSRITIRSVVSVKDDAERASMSQNHRESQDEDLQLRESLEIDNNPSWRIFRIMSEFVDGFTFLAHIDRSVTFFGSARLGESHPYYQIARELGKAPGEQGLHHRDRRRSRRDAGGQSGRLRRGWQVGRAEHPVAARAAHEPLCARLDEFPLLLQPQGDARFLRRSVHLLPWWLRHDG